MIDDRFLVLLNLIDLDLAEFLFKAFSHLLSLFLVSLLEPLSCLLGLFLKLLESFLDSLLLFLAVAHCLGDLLEVISLQLGPVSNFASQLATSVLLLLLVLLPVDDGWVLLDVESLAEVSVGSAVDLGIFEQWNHLKILLCSTSPLFGKSLACWTPWCMEIDCHEHLSFDFSIKVLGC